MKSFDAVTIFPGLLREFFSTGLLGKAHTAGVLELGVHDPRDFAPPPHRAVDDYSYGGGPGMLMKPQPIVECVESIGQKGRRLVVVTTPAGEMFSQEMAREFLEYDQIVVICGRYEGIDERVREILDARPVSTGPYVMMGGETAAMAIIETVARLVPGVIGNRESLEEESFEGGFLEYPQYTRPREFRGYKVPEVLLQGDHAKISAFRRANSRRGTLVYYSEGGLK